MIIELSHIRSLSDTELKREWENRGYKEYHDKIGKVSGLGWDSMDALINYSNYAEEMKERKLL